MKEKTDLQISFAARVMELRKRRGWSQDTLGELSGTHRNYIGHIERLEVCPGLVCAEKIALAFDMSLSDFLKSDQLQMTNST